MSVSELLAELKEDEMARLPSGVSLYSLLQQAHNEKEGQGNASILSGHVASSALVQILSRVPPADLLALQKGVHVASSSYRYYQYNSSLGTAASDIPTRSGRALYSQILHKPVAANWTRSSLFYLISLPPHLSPFLISLPPSSSSLPPSKLPQKAQWRCH